VTNLLGDYVTEEYARRDEAYDWFAVSIEKIHDRATYVGVRSRADIKRPTCTYDGVGLLAEPDTLLAEFRNTRIRFRASDDRLAIDSEQPENRGSLAFFCSGGGTPAGTCERLRELLDRSQLATDGFRRLLSWENLTFTITAMNCGSLNALRVKPNGLEVDNRLFVHEFEGTVLDAEIADLNAGSWPEILVYTQSAGSGSYGSVISYSANNGKCVSQIYLAGLVLHRRPKTSTGTALPWAL
jgi:hypothetical protein